MTIRISNVTVTPAGVQITAPGNFGSFTAIRLSNFSGTVMTITGINPDDPGSQEYLLPLQQNVYQTSNVSSLPLIAGVSSIVSTSSLVLLAEWSDDPLRDFPGTYPTAVSLGASTPLLTTSHIVLSAQFPTTFLIPANPLRKSLTLQQVTGGFVTGTNFWRSGQAIPAVTPVGSYDLYTQSPPADQMVWYGSDPTNANGGGQLAPGESVRFETSSQLYLWTTAVVICLGAPHVAVIEESYI